MSKPKPKRVNYRKCVFHQTAEGEKQSLQALLQEASGKVQRPWEKPENDEKLLLAHLYPRQSCLVGELAPYSQGQKVPLIGNEADGKTWQGLIEPTDSKGVRRNLQRASLFFAIRENHAAIIQSKEVGVDDLNKFLNWLIVEKAGLAKGKLFGLTNVPTPEAVAQAMQNNIRGISIKGQAFKPVKELDHEKMASSPGKKKRWKHSIKSNSWIIAMLENVIEDDQILEDLKNNDDPGSIWVNLDISYRSKQSKEGLNVLRDVAAAFGGKEDLETEIKLSGKSTIHGNKLTIRDDVEVQAPDGNISSDDAMTVLARWLIEAIQSGTVPI